MKKSIILCTSILLLSTSVYAQTNTIENMLSAKEMERKNKLETIAKERSEENGRFSRKAIERAKAREQRELEKQKERAENASRFQKEALEEEAQKVAEQKNLATTAEKSRFTQKAEAKAAQKEQEKLQRKMKRRK